MAFVSLEDTQGEIELVIFPKLWADVSEWMKEGLIVVAKGKVDTERGDPKVLVDKITDKIERVKLVSSISVKRKKEV
jgi:DNA polymerase-3 subunit alpha